MINEKDIVDRIERFYKSIIDEGNECIMITKDGYFVYRSDNSEDYEYYPTVFSLVVDYEDKLNSMLSAVERIFKSAILTAVEDAQKAIFDRYPNAIIHIDRNSVNFTETGNWDNSQTKESLYDLLSSILDIRSLINAG